MNIRHFINEQVPPLFQAKLPSLFRQGHQLAASIVQENPALQLPSLQQGDIRVATIDFILQRDIEQFGYGMSARFKSYAKPTGKYLSIECPGAQITISHLKHPSHLPRPAEFRRQARIFNHPELFDEYEQARVENNDRAHLLLIYGDQDLEFMYMGAMHAKLPCWLDAPVDLLRMAQSYTTTTTDDREGVDASIKMKVKLPTEELKNQFFKHLEANAAG